MHHGPPRKRVELKFPRGPLIASSSEFGYSPLNYAAHLEPINGRDGRIDSLSPLGIPRRKKLRVDGPAIDGSYTNEHMDSYSLIITLVLARWCVLQDVLR
jgi:hypothetical protein